METNPQLKEYVYKIERPRQPAAKANEPEHLEQFRKDLELDLERRVNGLYINYDLPFKVAEEEFEKKYLTSHLLLALGNRKQVERTTGLSYATIKRKIARLGIPVEEIDIRKKLDFPIKSSEIVPALLARSIYQTLADYQGLLPSKAYSRLESSVRKNPPTEANPRILNYKEAMSYFNCHYLGKKLGEFGTQKETAKQIGISDSTLSDRILKYLRPENEPQLGYQS